MRNHHEHFVPEEDIYLTLLVIVYLLDHKELSKVRRSKSCPFTVFRADDTLDGRES